MGIPTYIPEKKRFLLEQLIGNLSQVRGVEAIVLGGSYARGTYNDDSDLDIGLYYYEREPYSIADIRHIAADVSAQNTPVVTGFYEWGPLGQWRRVDSHAGRQG